MNTSTYEISTLRPAPSMMHDVVKFTGTYAEAVKAAQDSWRVTRRATSVSLSHHCYHRIDYKGIAIDTNKNSGIPEQQQIN